ncbi:MAG: Txe/YoeB family addiction module toxin [Flavobacteriaceae bacterium]|nr:MAG: Txe/YoeB family addiction module toxin [Flavobacteriaceae bacterium]
MSYHLDFTDKAKEDIEKFKKTGNKVILTKILSFSQELAEHPFTGTGKPELLKHNLTGLWSRRLNKEHRLVYKVEGDIVYVLSAFGHYEW